MTILIKDTLINLDLVESIHFDDYNARISVIFNSTNTRRFDFFDPNNATEEDWKEYASVVASIASAYNKTYTMMSRNNPFSGMEESVEKTKESYNGKEDNI